MQLGAMGLGAVGSSGGQWWRCGVQWGVVGYNLLAMGYPCEVNAAALRNLDSSKTVTGYVLISVGDNSLLASCCQKDVRVATTA